MIQSGLRQGLTPIARCASSSVASSSRLISGSAIASEARSPAGRKDAPTITTANDFLTAIAKPRRGDLSSISNMLGEGATIKELDKLDRHRLKEGGVPVKERRYFLWAREKFKQGESVDQFAIDIKPAKVVRGWGPRVQKGIRVRGRRRPGEK